MIAIHVALRKPLQRLAKYGNRTTYVCGRAFHQQLAMSADHLESTSKNSRNEVISRATVTSISEISPTVKMLNLHVDDERFTFKAGQWVDFFIQGLDVVGGFSICSSPAQLQTDRSLQLAVKYSNHPPAHWVHKQCEVGSRVRLKAGGDFWYDPGTQSNDRLLLVAGGVGINPLLSIMKTAQPLNRRVLLLYSSQTAEELIFKDEIDSLCRDNPKFSTEYFITACESQIIPGVNEGRIDQDRLHVNILKYLYRVERVLAYICGPPGMIDSVENMLRAVGLQKTQVKCEKWW